MHANNFFVVASVADCCFHFCLTLRHAHILTTETQTRRDGSRSWGINNKEGEKKGGGRWVWWRGFEGRVGKRAQKTYTLRNMENPWFPSQKSAAAKTCAKHRDPEELRACRALRADQKVVIKIIRKNFTLLCHSLHLISKLK